MLIDEIIETLEASKQDVEELDDLSTGAKREIQNKIDDAIQACEDADVDEEEDEDGEAEDPA